MIYCSREEDQKRNRQAVFYLIIRQGEVMAKQKDKN
jgi:hypothetical protein